MFICEGCNMVTKPGVKRQMVTIEARPKRYPARRKINRNGSDDPGGEGHEIVREVRACPTCVRFKED